MQTILGCLTGTKEWYGLRLPAVYLPLKSGAGLGVLTESNVFIVSFGIKVLIS